MNQNNKDSYKRFIPVSKIISAVIPVFAAVIALCYFAAMKFDYDSIIGHFERGSGAFAASVIFAVLAVLASAASYFLSLKTASLVKDPEDNPMTLFSAVLCGLLSFAFMIVMAADYSKGMLNKFDVIYAVLVPFAGISMILSVIPKLKFSAIRKVSAILAILAVNLSMFADYFDFALPLNSPVRNFITAAKAAALLYLLSEARFSFGFSSKRLFLPSTMLASGVCASVTLGYSVGAILASVFGAVASNPNPGVFELGFYAAIGLHAAGRLFTLIPAIGTYIPPQQDKKSGKDKNENNKNITE